MRASLSVARAAIGRAIESRVVRVALAFAAIFPSVPALAQRHEEGRRECADFVRSRETDRDGRGGARLISQAHAGQLARERVIDAVWYWYPAARKQSYCEAAKGYYPHVQSCLGGWKPRPPGSATDAHSLPMWQ